MKNNRTRSVVLTSCIFAGIVITILFFSCKKDKATGNIGCIPAGLANHVIAFYPFADGSLNDISGNNHHLLNSGSALPATDRDGNPDCAYAFSNFMVGNSYLVRPNPVFLDNLNAFSISLWYRATDTFRGGPDYEALISRDSVWNCPFYGQWSVSLNYCKRTIFGRTSSVSEPFDSCNVTVAAKLNHWHHVVATYNSNGTQMALYSDGILQGSSSGNYNCGSAGSPSPASAQDIGALFLGLGYNGDLDDVMILDKAVNQQEVNSLFTMGSCCAQ
ncbi:LamG domain-containing protein [Taibaiella helva]|uniref:LamG domain-containing protein n=1 Tax=Taibaiella helva TaxID=2301235 RepID=UPI000E58FED3|nr:LamG domain-containing protein [Taibaiella helva]